MPQILPFHGKFTLQPRRPTILFLGLPEDVILLNRNEHEPLTTNVNTFFRFFGPDSA
jgi:hypothetical protein